MAADPIFPYPSLAIDRHTAGDTVTAVCHGRVVSDTVPILQDMVRAMIAQAPIVVLDLDDVSYMDSSGLGALVGLYVSAKRSGKHLRLIHLSERVQELLRVSKLLSVLEGYGEFL
jgi:anti-sigma B factor antagonist